MSEFEREQRYAVIKFSHLTDSQKAVLASLGNEFEIPSVEAVVIEADWPEYEAVWRMIERRVTGSPAQSRLEMKHIMQALDQVRGRPVLTSNQCHDLAMLLNDYLPIEDAAQSELAALREELTSRNEVIAMKAREVVEAQTAVTGWAAKCKAAEQRNAELNGLLRELRNTAYTKGGISLAAYIDPHLKPTESGASE